MLISDSVFGRPGQSLYQKNHVTTEQMDGWRQDLEAGGRHHEQGDRRAR